MIETLKKNEKESHKILVGVNIINVCDSCRWILNSQNSIFSRCLICWTYKVHKTYVNIKDILSVKEYQHFVNICFLLWNKFKKNIKTYWKEWVVFYKWLKFLKWYQKNRLIITRLWVLVYETIKSWWIISREDAEKLVSYIKK